MVQLVFGLSKCPICGCVLTGKEGYVAFPAFVGDKDSPLRLFSDAALHKECFDSHPLAEEAQQLYEELLHRFYFFDHPDAPRHIKMEKRGEDETQ